MLKKKLIRQIKCSHNHFLIELAALKLTLIKVRLGDESKYHISVVGTIQKQPRRLEIKALNGTLKDDWQQMRVIK